MSPRARPSFALLFVISAAAAALDLGSKHWAEGALASPRSIVDGFFVFALAHNPGGAFSLLRAASDAVRVPLFVAVSTIAILAILWAYARSHASQWSLRLGLALILGGAIGNLVDRVRYGYVVDFIELYAKWGGATHKWPTFNVADVAICIGVGLLLLTRAAPRASAEIAKAAT